MSSSLISTDRKSSSAEWAVRLIPGLAIRDARERKKDRAISVHAEAVINHIGSVAADPEAAKAHSALARGRQAMGPEAQAETKNKAYSNVLIVGADSFGRRIAACLLNHPREGRVVRGFLDDECSLGNGVIGRSCDLARLARASFVDEIILAKPGDRELTLSVLRDAQQLHLDVVMALDLPACKSQQPAVRRVGNFPAIYLHRETLPVGQLWAKRVLDVVAAAISLLLFSPIFVLIGALIWCDSRGPIIYSAPRAGRKGQRFRCYKFRTMVVNADELKTILRSLNERSGPFFKISSDPRITRVGRWLRRYSLDELPQLWNVLRGEMSLVGPRPHPLDDFAAYRVEHLGRLDVTPGITGLWQVTARQDPSFDKGIELDREYIGNWSLCMDLQILCRTVLTVLRGSGT